MGKPTKSARDQIIIAPTVCATFTHPLIPLVSNASYEASASIITQALHLIYFIPPPPNVHTPTHTVHLCVYTHIEIQRNMLMPTETQIFMCAPLHTYTI